MEIVGGSCHCNRFSLLEILRTESVGNTTVTSDTVTWGLKNTPKVVCGIDEPSLAVVDAFVASIVDTTVADRVRYLATQARQPAVHYEHTEVGFNYRLSNLLAAFGRAQFSRLPGFVQRRLAINALYRELLGDVAGLSFMPVP